MSDLLGDADPPSPSLNARRAALRRDVEARKLPGESYQQAARRLHLERTTTGGAPRPIAAPPENRSVAVAKAPAPPPSVPRPKRATGRKPQASAQDDFFLPALYDVGTRDSRGVMDVALFRLSKRDTPGQIIRHELPDGFVEVAAGAHGMASVWDYDIILMAVSHLTEAMNRHRDGKGDVPGRTFKPHIGEMMKFLRRSSGGRQRSELLESLKRLTGTVLTIERIGRNGKGKLVTVAQGEPLIAGFTVHLNQKTKNPEYVEIEVPKWMHQEIVTGTHPDVLTVHPDYFNIEQGLGRFLYRLARRSAGRNEAKWSFKTLHERSGSTATTKKFNLHLRELIEANDLPEYELSEGKGATGPQLVIHYRGGERYPDRRLKGPANADVAAPGEIPPPALGTSPS